MRWAKLRGDLGKYLPISIKNRIRRWMNKREASRRTKLRGIAKARYGTFDGGELFSVLRESGIPEGCVLFVQSSFNDLYTFAGSPLELLATLRKLVGPSGTLLMPAFSTNCFAKPPRLFDVTREPTYTGIVNEIFRRSTGVERSLHPRHSICAEGPLAKELLSGHELCIRADGPDSPFDRMRRRDDAFILTLGLEPGFVSFLHWAEDIDPSKLPFPVHVQNPVVCQVKDVEGQILTVKDWTVLPKVAKRLDVVRFSRHLSFEAMNCWEYKGTAIGLYLVKSLAAELLMLRDKRIIHYCCNGG